MNACDVVENKTKFLRLLILSLINIFKFCTIQQKSELTIFLCLKNGHLISLNFFFSVGLARTCNNQNRSAQIFCTGYFPLQNHAQIESANVANK